MARRHCQKSLTICPTVRWLVGGARTLIASQHRLSRFRCVISGRSTSVRRSSARVTGFHASILLSLILFIHIYVISAHEWRRHGDV